MGSAIHPLPRDVINLIAAGEVIDSLAAVVRELAENAIDAQATRITIRLWPQQWRIQVTDNGQGMSLEDLQKAAIAHSTSKIRDLPDLSQIHTLGFRGEALHSLTQLAHLEICSRSTHSDQGWRVVYDNEGQVQTTEDIAIAPGTIVTVSDLFGNWLSRRQSLPDPAQQLRAIQQTLYQLALSHPQLTWQIYQTDREWLTFWPTPSLKQRLPQILPQIRPQDLCELETQPTPDSRIQLLLGLPDRCHRHRPDWVRVAVNGRFIQSPELEQTILQSLRRTVPRDRHPVCLAHFHLPPSAIDWNRHPAKTEIYLQDLETWQHYLTEAIEQTLKLNLENRTAATRTATLLKAAESAGGYQTQRHIQAPSIELAGDPRLKVLTQIHDRYILVETPSGLWLVEQHIAHERVLFEQLVDRWETVPLEPAVILQNLSPAQREQLDRLGLAADAFGENVWAIRTAPAMLADRADLAEALWELSLGGDLQTAQVATACRTAIRNGTPLSLSEMQTLIAQWQHTRNPHTCPHGRPICLTLEESSLARYFRRSWVIGKSHGI